MFLGPQRPQRQFPVMNPWEEIHFDLPVLRLQTIPWPSLAHYLPSMNRYVSTEFAPNKTLHSSWNSDFPLLASIEILEFQFLKLLMESRVSNSKNGSEGSYFIIRFWFQAWNMSGTPKVSGATRNRKSQKWSKSHQNMLK
mgnify:CR=1 FL=1